MNVGRSYAGKTPHDIGNHTGVLDCVVAPVANPEAPAATLVLARGFTSGQPNA